MQQLNKFYLLLMLAIIIAATIFSLQFLRAKKITVKPSETPLISGGYYEITTDDNDYILGNPGSPITVVLFSDFNCSACQKIYFEITKFVTEHPQNVRLFSKNITTPSLFFKTNNIPHRAAFCAGKQGKFWPYNDLLYTTKDIEKQEILEKIAEELKLNTNNWWQCVNSQEAKDKIEQSVTIARTLNVTEVPVIYMNNKRINLQDGVSITEMLTQFIAK